MPADLSLLDEIYNFCMARERERANGEVAGMDWEQRHSAQTNLRLYQELRMDIRARPWTGADGIDYFRAKAMRYREHPDYRPEWTLPER
jgi:hypothetical protein